MVAGKWELVGINGLSNPGAADLSIAIKSDGIPIIAYQDSAVGRAVVVQQFTNNSWSVISLPDLSKGEARFISMAISPDKTPYVTFARYSYFNMENRSKG